MVLVERRAALFFFFVLSTDAEALQMKMALESLASANDVKVRRGAVLVALTYFK